MNDILRQGIKNKSKIWKVIFDLQNLISEFYVKEISFIIKESA